MKKSTIVFGCLLLTLLPNSQAASAGKTATDQAFVDEAARGGKSEVELGNLAEKNASSAEVKQFGERMVLDHSKLNQGLAQAAEKNGLQVPSDLNSKQQKELQSLSKLSGKEFDIRYTKLMVQDHTDDLAAFQRAESATQNADLKKVIAEAIPVIRHHLDMAKANQQKLAAR